MKPGDIVVLRSGGPRMTLSSIRDDGSAVCFCKWFDESGELHKERFAYAELEPLNEIAED